ncbi:MAG: hypothetical protein IPO92_03780 [Saprospiraceae bacterium]|nr:hypothetical protein [Saprospiraceae bacterium]
MATLIGFASVSHNGDDGLGCFGGSVNPKHLISYKNVDDDFDTDWGFSGLVQYGLSFRDPKVTDPMCVQILTDLNLIMIAELRRYAAN